jgi:hypothetical protein
MDVCFPQVIEVVEDVQRCPRPTERFAQMDESRHKQNGVLNKIHILDLVEG